MGKVLVHEPHADTAALLEIVLRRLGHQPVLQLDRIVTAAGLDAAVIEPGDAAGRVAAHELAAHGVPLVFTSIYGPTRDLLALQPVAWLVKPFPLLVLENALTAALGALVRS